MGGVYQRRYCSAAQSAMARVSSNALRRPSSRSLSQYHSAWVCAPAAIAPGAHRESRNAQRERNVGIGRAKAEIGAQPKVPIDRAQSFKQRRIGGQVRGGAIADFARW